MAGTLVAFAFESGGDGPDCVLVLAYWEICSGSYEAAAELVGTAMHARFDSTAHHVLHRAVLDPPLQRHRSPEAREAAYARGRARTPAAALAHHGVTRPTT